MRWTRRALIGAMALGLIGTAGCGRGAAAAGRGPRGGTPRPVNPAMRAALDIIRVAPVVPFTPQQVQQLVPILQGLAASPDQPASQLVAQAQQIENILTATQKTALTNMGTAGGFQVGRGRAGGGGLGQAGPGAQFRGRGAPPGGAPRPSGTRGQSRSFSPSSVYQAAIAVLQGATPASSTASA